MSSIKPKPLPLSFPMLLQKIDCSVHHSLCFLHKPQHLTSRKMSWGALGVSRSLILLSWISLIFHINLSDNHTIHWQFQCVWITGTVVLNSLFSGIGMDLWPLWYPIWTHAMPTPTAAMWHNRSYNFGLRQGPQGWRKDLSMDSRGERRGDTEVGRHET